MTQTQYLTGASRVGYPQRISKNNKYIRTEDLKDVSNRLLFTIDILFIQHSSLI